MNVTSRDSKILIRRVTNPDEIPYPSNNRFHFVGHVNGFQLLAADDRLVEEGKIIEEFI